jgi:hypothetical protein
MTRAGFTHFLVSIEVIRGTGETREWRRDLSDSELALLVGAVKKCKPLGRAGALVLLEMPPAPK